MRAFLKRSVLFILFMAIVGCSFLAPKTNDLENIHQVYREEFITSAIPNSPNDQSDVACRAHEIAFTGSLQAIRDFQVKYPDVDPAITQHLYVLQAMIYLQSGRPGMARLIHKEFIDEQQLVKGRNQGYRRDALFAQNFGALTQGWITYCALDEQKGPFGANRFLVQQKDLEKAAGEIQGNLKDFTTTDPVADEGAIYLATSAALFQMWATKIKSDRCFFGKQCEAVGLTGEELERKCGADGDCKKKERKAAIRKAKVRDFASYRKLIGRFLSEPEKRLADSDTLRGASIGRFRYLAIYRYLGQTNGE
jgi:hypothetical protein